MQIETKNVVSVLLNDGWHSVADFQVDDLEFVEDGRAVFHRYSEDPPTEAFAFREDDGAPWIAGPLTALLAVTYRD